MKKLLLVIALTLFIFQTIVLAIAIDIGEIASDRVYGTSGYTIINLGNPANETGTITSVEIWAQDELANCEVATFYLVSGSNYSTRDTHTIGTVTAGSKQTFSGLDITVTSGDYIGVCFTGGYIEYDTSGCSGLMRVSGDYIPCTNVTFGLKAGRCVSLYGTGATPSGLTWNTKTITKWNTKTISSWNGM